MTHSKKHHDRSSLQYFQHLVNMKQVSQQNKTLTERERKEQITKKAYDYRFWDSYMLTNSEPTTG